MGFVRSCYINDVVGQSLYEDIVGVLGEIEAGDMFEDDDLIPDIPDGYVTLERFFTKWGRCSQGTFDDPVDLTVEDEIEQELDDIVDVIVVLSDDDSMISTDLESALSFYDELEEFELMNEDIGSISGDDESYLLS